MNSTHRSRSQMRGPRQRLELAACTALLLLAGLCLAMVLIGSPHPTHADPSATPATPAAHHGDSDSTARAAARLRIFPSHLQLDHANDQQSLVVVYTREDGVQVDVTDKAAYRLVDANLATIAHGVLRPKQEGQTHLNVRYGEHQASVPVVVRRADYQPAVSYRLDVIPVFMTFGCNAGACHGAARGQDGFMLSLFGYDPEGDYFRITREQPGRRINLAAPDRSLLIDKALGRVPHTGGGMIEPDSKAHHILRQWIADGAPNDDPKTTPTPESLELLPPRLVLESPGQTHRMTARVRYSDGTYRDVTDMALYMTSNDASVGIDKSGVITTAQRGEAFVFARYHTYTVGAQIIVIPRELDYQQPEPTTGNYIDQSINAKLHDLRILPSERSSDSAFIRRVYVDIIGQLPPREAYEAFIADENPDKRAKLIDELLERKEFAEMWVMKWSELLQIRSSDQMSYKAALLYHGWLQERIAENVPFNQIVEQLLSATGGTFTEPATNYYQNERDTKVLAENVAQVFLGIRLQCAQCHNHPFDRWTMDDYYGWTSFFTQVGRKRGQDPREAIVFNQGRGEINHPVTSQPVSPTFLGGETPSIRGQDRREVVGQWIASPENPYFAPNLANIVWAHFFGIGIIDPVDDVRISNPPSNPELLDALAKRFVDYNYDFKQLVRDICNSDAYQRSTQPNPSNELDTRNFARQSVRRIRAEVLLDAITQVTGTQDKFRGLPLGARAVQIADGTTTNYFLTTFGRARRETVCSCEVSTEPNLSQALTLLNGEVVNRKIAEGRVIQRMIRAGADDNAILDELFIRCLARRPTDHERARLLEAIAADDNRQQVLEDVFWALLNAREFLFNH